MGASKIKKPNDADAKKKYPNQDDGINISQMLGLGLIAVGLVSIYTLINSDSDSSLPRFNKEDIPAVVKTKRFEDAVNKHLMNTSETIELSKQRMALENANLNSDLQEFTEKQNFNSSREDIDFKGDGRAAETAALLGRGDKPPEIPLDPNDVIQRELFNKQQMEEYSEAYREEYARQFVENARRGGYKVQLSSDYRVLSVAPIKKSNNSNENVLNSSGRGIK